MITKHVLPSSSPPSSPKPSSPKRVKKTHVADTTPSSLSPGISFKIKIQPSDDGLDWFENIEVTAWLTAQDQEECVILDVVPKKKEEAVHQYEQTESEIDMADQFGCIDDFEDIDGEEAEEEDSDDYMHTSDIEVDGIEEAKAKNMGKKIIGNVFGRIIHRAKIRPHFWRDMEEPSQDTAALAFNLFDRYGCLREEFITGARSGSGLFGRELDTGDFLHVEIVNVNEGHRRRGLAKAMLNLLQEQASKLEHAPRHAFAWPAFLNRAIPDNIPAAEQRKLKDELETASVNLFRKVGFRRIGSTHWFAFAFSPAHPAYSVTMDADFNSPEPPPEFTELQKLERDLERKRNKLERGFLTVVVADQFKGHRNTDVKKLLQLRNVASPTKQGWLRVKYGCTCGTCIGGYVSPRMRVLMNYICELENDNDTYDDMSGLGGPQSTKDEEEFGFDFNAAPSWEYLAKDIRANLKTNKSYRVGHRMVFGHIITCLKQKQPPTIQKILETIEEASEWPPNTKNFLQRAGVAGIEAVLRYTIISMKEKDLKAGNGIDEIADYKEKKAEEDKITASGKNPADGVNPMTWIMRNFWYDEGAYVWTEMLKEKECRNDSEFGFVLGMLTGKVVDLEYDYDGVRF